MSQQEHSHLEINKRTKQRQQKQTAAPFSNDICILAGFLISIVLTVLFSIVILALIIKAFITSDEIAFQLLNAAVAPVSATLGAVLGYILGRHSYERPEGGK